MICFVGTFRVLLPNNIICSKHPFKTSKGGVLFRIYLFIYIGHLTFNLKIVTSFRLYLR